ncbi:MAG: 50S ribosomal protein L10 [Candidatus Altimarinota bacterium]
MAVSRAKKSEILSTLIENIKNAKSIGFAQTNGLTVSEFSDLRADLRTVNTSYNLAKKTLVRIAVKEALGIDLDLNLLPGQVGVICSNDDAVAGLSKANAYITKAYNKKVQVQKISWVASIFEGKVNGLEETKVIASMPSRETLLSRLVGSMMSPLSGMARFFDAAAKEVEAQGKSKVGELEGKKETTSETPSEETQA